MRTFWILTLLLFLTVGLRGSEQLSLSDVQTVFAQAITYAASADPHGVISVVDREGFVLGVWSVGGGVPPPEEIAAAIDRAGTGAFLSSNQNAFTSRTAGYILQQ